MQHQVQLSKLPEGVEFPAHLRERVEYDAQRQQLVFRGFMTKFTYDELTQLAKDVPYRDALEQLFVLSSEEIRPPAARRVPLTAIVAAAACALAIGLILWATLFRQPSPPAARPDVVHAGER